MKADHRIQARLTLVSTRFNLHRPYLGARLGIGHGAVGDEELQGVQVPGGGGGGARPCVALLAPLRSKHRLPLLGGQIFVVRKQQGRTVVSSLSATLRFCGFPCDLNLCR